MAIQLLDTQRVTLTAEMIDALGYIVPGIPDSALVWGTTDAAIASVTPHPVNPLAAELVAHAPGTTTVSCYLGSLGGQETVIVSPGAPVAYRIVQGTPEAA